MCCQHHGRRLEGQHAPREGLCLGPNSHLQRHGWNQQGLCATQWCRTRCQKSGVWRLPLVFSLSAPSRTLKTAADSQQPITRSETGTRTSHFSSDTGLTCKCLAGLPAVGTQHTAPLAMSGHHSPPCPWTSWILFVTFSYPRSSFADRRSRPWRPMHHTGPRTCWAPGNTVHGEARRFSSEGVRSMFGSVAHEHVRLRTWALRVSFLNSLARAVCRVAQLSVEVLYVHVCGGGQSCMSTSFAVFWDWLTETNPGWFRMPFRKAECHQRLPHRV